MTSSTSLIISGSSAEVGSSNSMACGSMASARAMATRCCCPPDSCAGAAVQLVGQPDAVQQLRPRAARLGARPPEHVDLREADILQRGHVREELEVLEHHADAGAQLRQVGLAGRRPRCRRR